jgi:translocator protein
MEQVTKKNSSKFKWYYCVIIYLVANVIGFIPAGYNGDEAFYNNFTQPNIAPPDWIFAPMWLFLNVTSLIGLYKIMNDNQEITFKKSIFKLEMMGWVFYAIFTILYFGMKSPILGAIDTVMGLIVVIIVCLKTYKNHKIPFFYFFPRLLWLILASYVSVWVAVKNNDVFFNN